MARKKSSLFDTLARAPWPAGILFGIAGFLMVRYGLAAFFSGVDNPYTSAIGRELGHGTLAPFAWIILSIGVVASIASWLGAAARRRLLDTRSGLASLQDINWKEFERLIGEIFRRRGYAVEETGGGGADGGVDLLLRKEGALELVQCKQYKRRQVPVSTVRETYGLLQHHRASKAWIVCCGDFTADARAFIRDKPIELLSGLDLLDAINQARTGEPASKVGLASQQRPASKAQQQTCPRCSSPMVKRTNRQTGAQFWGCSKHPDYRATLESPSSTCRCDLDRGE